MQPPYERYEKLMIIIYYICNLKVPDICDRAFVDL